LCLYVWLQSDVQAQEGWSDGQAWREALVSRIRCFRQRGIPLSERVARRRGCEGQGMGAYVLFTSLICVGIDGGLSFAHRVRTCVKHRYNVCSVWLMIAVGNYVVLFGTCSGDSKYCWQ
jgi:hypothetical protein